MRLRSRPRERPLSGKRKAPKIVKKTRNATALRKSTNSWQKVLPNKKDKNELQKSFRTITRSLSLLKTRPVRTKQAKNMEKLPDTTHKTKAKPNNDAKRPIFQTVVRSTSITSTTTLKTIKPAQNNKVTTTTEKTKPVNNFKNTRHSSLNRELRCKTEVLSSDRISSPRKTRRMDKPDKAASLNSSPIRKLRQISSTTVTKTTITVTNETRSRRKIKVQAVPTPEHSTNEWSEEHDETMYEPHTTFVGYPTPKASDESDSDANLESTDLCLPNDCLNDFMAINECANLLANEQLTPDDDDINFLADKAARIMTANDKCQDGKKVCSRNDSTEKRLIKRRKSSNDLEINQPTSTTDDLEVCTDFLNGEKYVQVNIILIHYFCIILVL